MRLGASRRGVMTPALPIPYPALEASGLRLRLGQTSLWVAAPGVGKSQLLNNICQRMPVPSLFWSADTDQHDVTVRSMAMWSGSTTSEVEAQYRDPAWQKFYADKMSAGAHVEWVFDPAITGPLLDERLKAFLEVHGEFPKLTVVDNLSNTVQNTGDELSEQKEVMAGMQRIARKTGSHVAILAHAKGEYDRGDKPIPQNGILNNLSKIPELVVTLHRQDDSGELLGVNVVKNRGGKADPAARHAIQLQVDYSRATVGGFRTSREEAA